MFNDPLLGPCLFVLGGGGWAASDGDWYGHPFLYIYMYRQYITGIQEGMGFIAVFFGSLEVQNEGTYTFCLDSHDGSAP
jgi:hypothetical protein